MNTVPGKQTKEQVMEQLKQYFEEQGHLLALEKGAVEVVFKNGKLDKIKITRHN